MEQIDETDCSFSYIVISSGFSFLFLPALRHHRLRHDLVPGLDAQGQEVHLRDQRLHGHLPLRHLRRRDGLHRRRRPPGRRVVLRAVLLHQDPQALRDRGHGLLRHLDGILPPLLPGPGLRVVTDQHHPLRLLRRQHLRGHLLLHRLRVGLGEYEFEHCINKMQVSPWLLY